MPTVKGNLMFVSSRAAQVSEVWVRAPRVRTHVEGVVTTGNDRFPVDGGEVSFTAVPGPAVLALITQGRAVDTIPILVGDAATQTLRQVVSAAEMVDGHTRDEMEKLALDAAAHVATSGANAKRAENAANKAATAVAAEKARTVGMVWMVETEGQAKTKETSCQKGDFIQVTQTGNIYQVV